MDANGLVELLPSMVDDGSTVPANHALTVSPNQFNCSHAGTTQTVRLNVVDMANVEQSSCLATVTIADNLPPSLTCSGSATLTLDQNGQVDLDPFDIIFGLSDNCGVNFPTAPIASFDCTDVGQQTFVFSIDDDAGNTATCSNVITIIDNTLPNAICKDITVPLDVNGEAVIGPADVNDGSIDGCGTLSLDQSNFDCSHIGANTVVLTITDANNGNVTSSCNAMVTIEDNIPPTINCPSTYTAELDQNGNVIVAPFFLVTVADNCGVPSFPLNNNVFNCSHVGQNLNITYSSTDGSNNTSTCTMAVTVVDNRPPIPNCNNITLQLDANGQASITSADINNNSTDNCGIANFSLSKTSFDCSNIGSNTVVFTVTDIHGNQASCNATVTVEDNIPPNTICVANNSVSLPLDANGFATLSPSMIDAGSSDNCAIISNGVTVSPNSFDCSDLGSQTVTLTVSDVNGNSATCTTDIMVVDNLGPVLNCSSPITVNLINGQAPVVPFLHLSFPVTDNCDGNVTTPVSGGTVFSCNDVGQQTVVFSTTDNAGNVGTCTISVTVQDNTAPVVNCKNIAVSPPLNGSVTIQPEDLEDGASTDDCGIASKFLSQNTFSCNDAGLNTVVLTVSDVNGNVTTCNAGVTVICPALPVELREFSVVQNKNNAILKWATASEINNATFSIEHRTDQLEFVEIGNVAGQGTQTNNHSYQFIHEHPTAGSNYYRLRQTDFDGNFTYSPIRHLRFDSKESPQLQIFPNPATEYIEYRLSSLGASADMMVSIYNSSMHQVFSGPYGQKVKLSNWAPGIYWISIEGNGQKWQSKFIIH